MTEEEFLAVWQSIGELLLRSYRGPGELRHVVEFLRACQAGVPPPRVISPEATAALRALVEGATADAT